MDITTDHKWKNFRDSSEVPTKVLAEDYTHLDLESEGMNFMQYKGDWYHLSDFMKTENMEPWQGMLGMSAFSCLLLEISRDTEQYRIGSYSC